MAKIASVYQVYRQKAPLQGGYTMEQSSAIELMDPRETFSGIITGGEPTAQALGQLRSLIRR